MLHRLRFAQHQGSINKMTGTVEADETFVGGKARNMHADKRAEKIHGRGPEGKAIVFGLLERETGKVRTKGALPHENLPLSSLSRYVPTILHLSFLRGLDLA